MSKTNLLKITCIINNCFVFLLFSPLKTNKVSLCIKNKNPNLKFMAETSLFKIKIEACPH